MSSDILFVYLLGALLVSWWTIIEVRRMVWSEILLWPLYATLALFVFGCHVWDKRVR